MKMNFVIEKCFSKVEKIFKSKILQKNFHPGTLNYIFYLSNSQDFQGLNRPSMSGLGQRKNI